jgi:hypothetical protein
MLPSTKKQRQLIGIACGQLGIDSETKAEMLFERYGREHTTEIGKVDADDFLKELEGRGFRIVSKRPKRQRIPRDGGKTVSMVSSREIEKMTAVANLIKWRVENGLELWMKKRLGIERVRTGGDAYRVIEGLKKMFENQMKKAHGADWWVGIYDDPGIMTFIWEHCPQEWRCGMQRAWFEAGLIRAGGVEAGRLGGLNG